MGSVDWPGPPLLSFLLSSMGGSGHVVPDAMAGMMVCSVQAVSRNKACRSAMKKPPLLSSLQQNSMAVIRSGARGSKVPRGRQCRPHGYLWAPKPDSQIRLGWGERSKGKLASFFLRNENCNQRSIKVLGKLGSVEGQSSKTLTMLWPGAVSVREVLRQSMVLELEQLRSPSERRKGGI